MSIDRMWSVAEGQELSDNLRCSICTDAFHNPRRLSNCGHYFCESCISAWNETNHICPIDRTPISPTSNTISGPDRIVVQFLDELIISCTFCGFQGKKGLHQCAAFSCPFDHCTFKDSDDDGVKRHMVTCRWNNDGSTRSAASRKAARVSHSLVELAAPHAT
ncbi:hypothetical protein BC830DRAFT_642667 [Chytriomyces sp. MP71]|nr:hypothetical protein BC830DRAFT_642667 [Chytriomyces sp. MP71]